MTTAVSVIRDVQVLIFRMYDLTATIYYMHHPVRLTLLDVLLTPHTEEVRLRGAPSVVVKEDSTGVSRPIAYLSRCRGGHMRLF